IAEPSLHDRERMTGLHALESDLVIPWVRGEQFLCPLESLSIHPTGAGQFTHRPKSTAFGDQRSDKRTLGPYLPRRGIGPAPAADHRFSTQGKATIHACREF